MIFSLLLAAFSQAGHAQPLPGVFVRFEPRSLQISHNTQGRWTGCGEFMGQIYTTLEYFGARRARVSCDDRSSYYTLRAQATFEAPVPAQAGEPGSEGAWWQPLDLISSGGSCMMLSDVYMAVENAFVTQNTYMQASCGRTGGSFFYRAEVLYAGSDAP